MAFVILNFCIHLWKSFRFVLSKGKVTMDAASQQVRLGMDKWTNGDCCKEEDGDLTALCLQGGTAAKQTPSPWGFTVACTGMLVYGRDSAVDSSIPIPSPIPKHQNGQNLQTYKTHTLNIHERPHWVTRMGNKATVTDWRVQTAKCFSGIRFYYFQIQGHPPYSALRHSILQFSLVHFFCQEKPQTQK